MKVYYFAKLQVYLGSISTNHSQTWQFYFLGSIFSGGDGFSLTTPCKKFQKTVKGSIVKPCDCLIIARNFLDQSETIKTVTFSIHFPARRLSHLWRLSEGESWIVNLNRNIDHFTGTLTNVLWTISTKRVLRYNTIHKDSLWIVGFVAYLSPMDIKRSYHEFTTIKPKKQQTDFRFTQQGNEHDKDNINSSHLRFTYVLNHRTKRSTSKKLAKERCSDQTTKGKKNYYRKPKACEMQVIVYPEKIADISRPYH